MSSLQYSQQPNSSSFLSPSTEEARQACIITIQDDLINPTSLQFISMSSSFNTTTTLPQALSSNPSYATDQLLTKTILGFALCAVLPLITLANDDDARVAKPLEWFVFFLLLAFCTSVASIASAGRDHDKATAIFHCLSVLSTALAFASIASLFLHSWFHQVAAYGLCGVPLYAYLAPINCEYLLRQLKKAKLWWKKSEVEEADISERGMHGDSE